VNLKKLPARFYATPSGKEPVREWLKNLDEQDRRTVGQDISDVEFGWPVGMPLCRGLGDGLQEVRSSISNKRIARVIFIAMKQEMVLLHGFIKKTQKTPKPDIELALKRKKDVERNEQKAKK